MTRVDTHEFRCATERGRRTTTPRGGMSCVRGPSPRLFNFFSKYAQRYVGRHFHAARLSGAAPDVAKTDAAVVVYLNHPSWWDPMTCVVLAARFFPGRQHFAPIDAAALRRYGFFRRLGFFGVEPNSHRGAAQFLRAGLEVLGRPGAMLWVTAEGAFRDPRERPVRLQPGLSRLLCRASAETVVLPLAVEYPFWQERTPEMLMRFGEQVRVAPGRAGGPVELHRDLEQRLERTMDQLRADALSRDAARFQTIVGGSAGVGGIYDRWRRAVALLHGERFVAEHGARE